MKITEGKIGETYYTHLHDYIYKIMIYDIKNYYILIKILESNKGLNSYTSGAYVYFTINEKIFNTKDEALNDMFANAKYDYKCLCNQYNKVLQELENLKNQKKHFEEIFKLYDKKC